MMKEPSLWMTQYCKTPTWDNHSTTPYSPTKRCHDNNTDNNNGIIVPSSSWNHHHNNNHNHNHNHNQSSLSSSSFVLPKEQSNQSSSISSSSSSTSSSSCLDDMIYPKPSVDMEANNNHDASLRDVLHHVTFLTMTCPTTPIPSPPPATAVEGQQLSPRNNHTRSNNIETSSSITESHYHNHHHYHCKKKENNDNDHHHHDDIAVWNAPKLPSSPELSNNKKSSIIQPPPPFFSPIMMGIYPAGITGQRIWMPQQPRRASMPTTTTETTAYDDDDDDVASSLFCRHDHRHTFITTTAYLPYDTTPPNRNNKSHLYGRCRPLSSLPPLLPMMTSPVDCRRSSRNNSHGNDHHHDDDDRLIRRPMLSMRPVSSAPCLECLLYHPPM